MLPMKNYTQAEQQLIKAKMWKKNRHDKGPFYPKWQVERSCE
jgi:hypothetical protein